MILNSIAYKYSSSKENHIIYILPLEFTTTLLYPHSIMIWLRKRIYLEASRKFKVSDLYVFVYHRQHFDFFDFKRVIT